MIKQYKFKTKPYEHQLKALEKSWAAESYALFMEMGTGKSKVLVDNIAMLYDKGAIRGALIVAPKGVYKNWDAIEFPTHLPDHIECTKVLWEPTATKKKQAELDTLFDDKGDLKVLIMNVEAFSTTKGLDFARSFLNIFVGRALIGVDESTTIKNPTAKRTKNILKIGDLAKYRRILTGSPVTKSPLDLFSQCMFLDPYLLGYDSYYAYRSRYAKMVDKYFGGRRVQVVDSYRRLEELLPLQLCCCEHNDLVANFMLEYPGHDDGDPATCQNDYGATRDSLGPRAPTPCPRKRSPCPAAGCSAPARTSTRAIAFRCPLVLKYNFSSGVATE